MWLYAGYWVSQSLWWRWTVSPLHLFGHSGVRLNRSNHLFYATHSALTAQLLKNINIIILNFVLWRMILKAIIKGYMKKNICYFFALEYSRRIIFQYLFYIRRRVRTFSTRDKLILKCDSCRKIPFCCKSGKSWMFSVENAKSKYKKGRFLSIIIKLDSFVIMKWSQRYTFSMQLCWKSTL